MNAYRRVAFLPDTFHEINGVAHTSRHLEQFARRRQIPFLTVRPGTTAGISTDGPVTLLDLKRGPFSFGLDAQLACDPFMLRHAPTVKREMQRLAIEVVHITGPGDMGNLGWYLASKLRLPLVIGWHTNLHEYAGTRLQRLLQPLGAHPAAVAANWGERRALDVLRFFYRNARLVLAPNNELVDFVGALTGRPTVLMRRGIDSHLFSPARRARAGGRFRIGYVGRLTPEKNVRFLAELGRALLTSAKRPFEFVLVGQGNERDWLRANVPNATLPGVLTGVTLAEAYADMDLFVFPSETDTFGNVVLEAMASGLPCVVTGHGGPKFLVQNGVTGYVADNNQAFIRFVTTLVNDLDRRDAMGVAAQHYAAQLSWDAVFDGLFRNYETIFTRGASQPPIETRYCLSA